MWSPGHSRKLRGFLEHLDVPEGLRLDRAEGAGEVQTPLHGAAGLRVGDRVWFRHAKAGALCERFDVVFSQMFPDDC